MRFWVENRELRGSGEQGLVCCGLVLYSGGIFLYYQFFCYYLARL